MRYLMLLGLSLLVWGCEEDPPVHNFKPRTEDLIAVGVVAMDNGETRVRTQYVDRWKEVRPVGLDSQPAYDPQYRFGSRTLRLDANGRWFQSTELGDNESGMTVFYDKISDGYLDAGVEFGSCDTETQSTPAISVYNENNQLIRYARLSCSHSYLHYWSWDEMQIWPVKVVKLANGNLLYWGIESSELMRMTCVTQYGEVLWSYNPRGGLNTTSLASLRFGGYGMVDQAAEMVRIQNDDGVSIQNLEFSTTDEYEPHGVIRLENTNYIVAGVNRTTYDPHLWTIDASGTVISDTTLAIDHCQDSVAIFGVNANILLVCRDGAECGGPGSQTVVMLDSNFNIIGQESFGGNSDVVLKDVTVADDGSILLCGAYDRGIGSYSAVITKYRSDLSVDWRTVMHP